MPAKESNFTIRPTNENDWENVRALRLEMLLDTPIAFSETIQDALSCNETEWRVRAARGQQPQSISFAAITRNGRWIGGMGAYLKGRQPLLVGVYVSSSHRGRIAGVTDALLAGILSWTAQHGDMPWLEVHEDNQRAIKAYERRGFQRTGSTQPYNLDPNRHEIEMSKRLDFHPRKGDRCDIAGIRNSLAIRVTSAESQGRRVHPPGLEPGTH
jgi:GNAT superfamily N-acetyltransferase